MSILKIMKNLEFIPMPFTDVNRSKLNDFIAVFFLILQSLFMLTVLAGLIQKIKLIKPLIQPNNVFKNIS
jgi:hypothetical protein